MVRRYDSGSTRQPSKIGDFSTKQSYHLASGSLLSVWVRVFSIVITIRTNKKRLIRAIESCLDLHPYDIQRFERSTKGMRH